MIMKDKDTIINIDLLDVDNLKEIKSLPPCPYCGDRMNTSSILFDKPKTSFICLNNSCLGRSLWRTAGFMCEFNCISISNNSQNCYIRRVFG